MLFQASHILFCKGQILNLLIRSHLPLYVKEYHKQKVLCSYMSLPMFFPHVDWEAQGSQNVQDGEVLVAIADWKEIIPRVWNERPN